MWAEFETLFRKTYIPKWVHEQRVYEFIELQQGSITVAQYKIEFVALARYALELVTLESRKVSKFERGLRPEIHHAMAGVQSEDFPIVVQPTYAIEKNIQEAKGE